MSSGEDAPGGFFPTTFHLGKPLTTTSGLGASTVAGRRSTLLSARANAS
jgi:putative transposase